MDIDNRYGNLQIQKDLLELLKAFNMFCTDHDIRYSLEGGSLLGAIRHNGFIPWDDDIDIVMSRKDFDKLRLSIGVSELMELAPSHWIYKVRKKKTKKNSNCKESALIDIMVLDVVPNNVILRKIQLMAIILLQGMMKHRPYYHKKEYSLMTRIVLFVTFYLGKLFSYDFKLRAYHRICQIGNNGKSKQTAIFTTLYKYLPLTYVSDLLDVIELHQFEDINVPIMSKHDYFLRKIYGDNYMTPPPLEERIPLHRNNNSQV